MEKNTCHWCQKELSPVEMELLHCIKCNEKRLDKITPDFDPCPNCQKRIKNKTGVVKQ